MPDNEPCRAELDASIAAIRESLADIAAGRTKSLAEWDRDFCKRYNTSEPDFHVLYQDEHIIALDKPPGLLAVPGRGPEKFDSLASRVQAQYPDARVVHRLDMETSGVMLMALDPESHRRLNWQFEQRETKKKYVAIVAGQIADEEGTIDQPIVKDFDRPPRHKICHEHGREAISHWRVMERLTERTRVELFPVTGRSHQLRIHMRHLGHPILGDVLYAPDGVQAMSDRLLLHAAELRVMHPTRGEELVLQSDCPFLTSNE